MKPRVFISIATSVIGGPGKGLLQFLRLGGAQVCDPVVAGFCIGTQRGQFDVAMGGMDVPFELLRQRLTYDPLLVPQALRIVRRYGSNILQSHGYKSHLLCLILKRLTGLPWIAYVHGWTSENLKIKVYNALDQVQLGFADRVVVVSESLIRKLNLGWIAEDRVRVVPNAVDPDEFVLPAGAVDVRRRFGIADDCMLLGVIGRFSPEKGQLVFVEALPAIRRGFPGVRVLFVGDGQDQARVRARARELGQEDAVVFAGYQKELAPFYNALDLVVMPSLSEGMPNVALEAMLCGKPVVATCVGGVPEVVQDRVTGRVARPRDPAHLAECILEALREPGCLKSYGEAGRKRVLTEFDPRQRVRRIAGLYDEVLLKAASIAG
jgi:glycosyltransferase involved in cell wall biosynthesis